MNRSRDPSNIRPLNGPAGSAITRHRIVQGDTASALLPLAAIDAFSEQFWTKLWSHLNMYGRASGPGLPVVDRPFKMRPPIRVPTSRPILGTLLLATALSSLGNLAAFAANAAPEQVQFRQKTVAAHLAGPQAVAPVGRDTVLVAERSGRVMYVKANGRVDLGAIKVPGAEILYVSQNGYTEGLKDLISVPGTDNQFIWCMTTAAGNKVRWSVGHLELALGNENSASMTNSIIWQSEPQVFEKGALGPFSGCRMAFNGSDLNVAMGANDRHHGSGRIVQISSDHGQASTVVSTGHRNPGGIVVMDGNTWEVEFGPAGGDELNLIVPGGDYGWPQVSKGEPQEDGEPQGSGTAKHFLASQAGSIDPVVSWTPAINPAGMTVWRGKIYISALSGSVMELTMSGTKLASQRQFLEIGDRVRDVRASRDGTSLWVLTDGPDARLISVEPTGTSQNSTFQ